MASYSCRKILFALMMIAGGLAGSLVAIPSAAKRPEISPTTMLPELSVSYAIQKEKENITRPVIASADEKEQRVIAWASLLAVVSPNDDEVISTLTQIIRESEDRHVAYAAQTLGEVDYRNPLAVEALSKLYQSADNYYPDITRPTRANIAFRLGLLGPKNPLAATALIHIIQGSEHYLVLDRAFSALGRVGQDNEDVIALLENIIEEGFLSENSNKVWYTASVLEKIDPGNPKAVSRLVKLFYSSNDPDAQRAAANVLVDIAPEDAQTVDILKRYLSFSYERNTRYWAADKLGEAGINNSEVTSTLLSLVVTPFAEAAEDRKFVSNRQLAAQQLQETAKGNEEIIDILSRFLRAATDLEMRSQIAAILGEIDPGNPQAVTALNAVIEQYEAISNQTYNIQQQTLLAAERLAKVSPNNALAISTLRNLLNTSQAPLLVAENPPSSPEIGIVYRPEDRLEQYAKVKSRAATSLVAITNSNEQATDALVALLELQSDHAVYIATETLREIGTRQPTAIEALEQILSTSQSDSILSNAAGTLWAIDPGNIQAPATLLSVIQNASSVTGSAISAADSLRSIGKGNSDVVAALTEIVHNHQIAEIRLLAAGVLVDTNAGDPQVIALIRRMLAQAKSAG